MAAERHPKVGDVIFSRGSNTDDGDAWDDTELIEAWDAALADYRSHHSKEVKDTVAPFSSMAKALDTKRKHKMESAQQPDAKRVRTEAEEDLLQADANELQKSREKHKEAQMEDDEKDEEDDQKEEERVYQTEGEYHEEKEKAGHEYERQDPSSWYGYQHQQQPGYSEAAAAPGIPSLPTDNQDLSNLIMAWYYAGYYTGYYQGARRR
ncbi:hypothetical protein BCR43DRAFT_482108 [Syncephalastrum racemosum]|uniref:Survival Motor Neuron Gemin2-binding domain-containing protein n=1 Tax=Syncephalastrum racemosum TaxID=13706 RepID=A0A1X2HT24_SYNRA|nr:hypothetical protein BCR43DRAFT_482108 [Syncephalastrum racemosum]